MRDVLHSVHSKADTMLALLFHYKLKWSPMSAQDVRLIFSETRGGSTWLMELLQQKGVVVQWEPLHPVKGTIGRGMNLGDRPFVPPETFLPALYEEMYNVFNGSMANSWTAQFNRPLDVLKPQSILVKFVRGNLLLEWILQHFTLTFPPVFLVRHPVAVAWSQLQSFTNTYGKDPVNVIPDCTYNDRFFLHADYLASLATPIERQVAWWCLNNQNVIANSNIMSQVQVVHYEYLLSDPASVVKEITRKWEMHEIPQAAKLRMASKTSYNTGPAANVDDQLQKWKKALLPEELQKVQEVLNYFSVTMYNTDSVWPIQEHQK